MKIDEFVEILGSDFLVGVPDSQLKALCNYLMRHYGIDGRHHIIAANEGNAVGIAAGYHLATGKVPVVYMQNSGEGNAVNPMASLLHEHVYGIPCVFVIGWRGEPGVHDEPQHIYQGEITLELLQLMGIAYKVVSAETTTKELEETMHAYREHLVKGHSLALIIRKNALIDSGSIDYNNRYKLVREDVIRHIVDVAGDDQIVCTTGKAGRELFEIRQANRQGHAHDFLAVGSMGHASSIALGLAMNSNRRIWCIDGDGALLMHMGAMGVIGHMAPEHMIHVVLNNQSHESVGGLPTAVSTMDLCGIAQSCGYKKSQRIETEEDLRRVLEECKHMSGTAFLEVMTSIASRDDLGRPSVRPIDNKRNFMKEQHK